MLYNTPWHTAWKILDNLTRVFSTWRKKFMNFEFESESVPCQCCKVPSPPPPPVPRQPSSGRLGCLKYVIEHTFHVIYNLGYIIWNAVYMTCSITCKQIDYTTRKHVIQPNNSWYIKNNITGYIEILCMLYNEGCNITPLCTVSYSMLHNQAIRCSRGYIARYVPCNQVI